MKKKIVIIFIIVIAVFIMILAAVPLLFKQKLLEATKSTINKNINAKVEFADFNLSLFKGFPKVSLGLKDVTVVGKDEFQQDTLFSISLLQTKMSLKSLFSKSGRSIEEVILEQPRLHLISGKSGNVNWDLAIPDSSEVQQVADIDDDESSFQLKLEKIEIKNATVVYEDRVSDMLLDFNNVNIDVAGDMYGSATELMVKGVVDAFSVKYGGVTYIANTRLETKTLLNVDYEKMNISVKENELLINRLPLEVTGSIQIPSDSMFFDMSLQTKSSDFENFLALVPPNYEEQLKNIKTTGSATVSGTVKGLFFDEIYPAFSLNVDVANGNFHYTDLPEEIKNIKADISVNKPEGVLDLTEVTITDAHAEVRNSPVDLTLKLDHLVSDVRFDGALVGKINFNHLKDALPLDSVNLSGIVDANLFVKGRYSAIEKEQYDKIQSDGVVLLDNFIYDSPKFTQKIMVPNGRLDFSSKSVDLSTFSMKVGQSDFNLSGKVSNYLNYIFKDGTLDGTMQLTSSLLNVNELLRLQVPEERKDEGTEKVSDEAKVKSSVADTSVLAFNVPENIDFTFRSNIKQAIFDRIPISDITGTITAKEGKLELKGLDMNMLDGTLKLTGSYANTAQNQPLFDVGLDVKKIDIPQAYQRISGLQKMLPVAGQSDGKLSTKINMKGQLTPQLQLKTTTIDGTGVFNTENLHIDNSPVFNQLKGILKAEKLQSVTIDDFKANFTVENGNLLLKPFSTKVAGQETKVSGSLNARNLLDMRLDFNIQREAFGSDIQSILSAIPGNKTITLVPAGVIIKGPVGKPEVKMDLSETRKTITKATKEGLQKSLNKLGEGLKELFK